MVYRQDLGDGKHIDLQAFDEAEYYKNVAIQVLIDNKTGDVSIGWIRLDNTEQITQEEYDEILREKQSGD